MKIIYEITKEKGIEKEMKGWRDYWYENYGDFWMGFGRGNDFTILMKQRWLEDPMYSNG